MKHFTRIAGFLLIGSLVGCAGESGKEKIDSASASSSATLSTDEARLIARDAYTYFFPMVDA